MTLKDTLREERAPIIILAASTILLIVSVVIPSLWFLALVPIVLCGIPIVKEFIEDLLEKQISAEALVLMAMIGCVILKEFTAAAEVAIIMAIGELLEDAISDKAMSRMEALGKLKTDKAHLLTETGLEDATVEKITPGDVIRILPGETVPLDGIVIDGSSSINKSAVTGESIPEDVEPGCEVLAGTSNLYGSIDVEVTKCCEDSMISRMENLMKNADAGKSRIVGVADRWSKYILAGAIVITIATYLVTKDVYKALTIMVVFCPCAFILATPTGIMAAAGNMAKNGILLKDASAIDGLAKVDTVVFDKTGTLTTGDIKSLGYTNVIHNENENNIEGMVSALESLSEHPLGKTIAESHKPHGKVDDFKIIPGMGITGTVDGIRLYAGNKALMSAHCPENLDVVLKECDDKIINAVLVGTENGTVGFFNLEDRIKEESPDTIRRLKDMGMKTVMLTGDNPTVGKQVSDALGLDDAVYGCLPSDKLNAIEILEKDRTVCMLGDGINDAPSLKRSTVGISMGSIGNDLAVEASDIIFMNDDVSKMPGLIDLSRYAIKIICIGLTLSMTINIIGVILAIAGAIGPIAGAIIHNVGSVAVVLLAASVLWSKHLSQKNEVTSTE